MEVLKRDTERYAVKVGDFLKTFNVQLSKSEVKIWKRKIKTAQDDVKKYINDYNALDAEVADRNAYNESCELKKIKYEAFKPEVISTNLVLRAQAIN